MKKRERLGEMIVKAGLLTEEQLQEALAASKKTGLMLGQYLTRQGLVDEPNIIDLLCRQLNLKEIPPRNIP